LINFPNFQEVLKNIVVNIKSHYSYAIYIMLLIMSLLIFSDLFGLIKLGCNNSKKPQIIIKEGYKADYSKDKSYLGCINEQLSCLYKNLEEGLNNEKIIELCGSENYCAISNSNSK
jgi:hypothetical protein